MEDKEFKYVPMMNDELQKLWNKHKRAIEAFVTENGYNSDNIYINEEAVMAIIAKVDQRRKYFKYFHGLDMSEYKEVALICFWYVKLHPICSISKEVMEEDIAELKSINEKMAVYYLLTTLKAILKKKKMSTDKVDSLPDEYIKELIYSLVYRDLSKEALILLVESIAMFMGLNPYNASGTSCADNKV